MALSTWLLIMLGLNSLKSYSTLILSWSHSVCTLHNFPIAFNSNSSIVNIIIFCCFFCNNNKSIELGKIANEWKTSCEAKKRAQHGNKNIYQYTSERNKLHLSGCAPPSHISASVSPIALKLERARVCATEMENKRWTWIRSLFTITVVFEGKMIHNLMESHSPGHHQQKKWRANY